MRAIDLPIENGDEACRVFRALGAHRYVAGYTHLVHAFVIDAASLDARSSPAHEEWARNVIADVTVDKNSRDERLYRRLTTPEVAELLAIFWVTPTHDVRDRLRKHVSGVDVSEWGTHPFDPEGEDDLFPILVDAGWELLRYGELDRTRHRGLVESFGEEIYFESACFEEANAIPAPCYLCEWPALGERELLIESDSHGAWTSAPDLWVDAPERYINYVLSGVLRAARLA